MIWIHTQDDELFEVNGFSFSKYNNKVNIFGFNTANSNEDMFFICGSYSSIEKAKKVIIMIKSDILKSRPIFKMPKDEEV